MKDEIFFKLKKGEGNLQLICFPYLGGYANSFFELANNLNDNIEIWSLNPPGHGGCSREPLQEIHSLLDLYAKELQVIIKPNCIFFGYSMGGIVAYFLIQRMLNADEYPTKPVRLILCACGTPADFNIKKYSLLSDNDLIQHLLSYEGISEVVVNERSLIEYFLPIFRADFKILESSSTCNFKPLNIPTYILWGENDKAVSLDSTLKWLKYFSNEINLIPIENGTHMFIHDKLSIVTRHIENIVFQGCNPTTN